MLAFITCLRRSFGFVWDVLVDLFYFIRHLMIIAEIPNMVLSVTIWSTVKVIAGWILRQEPLHRLFALAEHYLDDVDINSSSKDEPLSNAVPSIPLYMVHHRCEFSLSSVTANSVVVRPEMQPTWDERQDAELHIGGHHNLHTAGNIKAMLKHHCHGHPLDTGMLEMGERIYTGPAEWILKAMEDDKARYAAALESHVPEDAATSDNHVSEDDAPDDATPLENYVLENGALDDAATLHIPKDDAPDDAETKEGGC